MQHDLVTDQTNFLLEQTGNINFLVKGNMNGSASGYVEKYEETRRVVYQLYKSFEGKFVVHSEIESFKPHKIEKKVGVYSDLSVLLDYFGCNSVAKEMYDQAKLSYTETVD